MREAARGHIMSNLTREIERVNHARIASGRAPLDVLFEIEQVELHFARLIEDERASRRAEFGDAFPDNHISRISICWHLEPKIREFIGALVERH